ncbi:MAG TPA: nicotinamide mononucleotide transporter [Sphingobium sp.]|uniref:nicotinamide riboside transporter PnuC n=1 Tax=unclassified Sphingobium TaxID=2611147 RepID=UPI000EBEFAD2|nr:MULTISPECIES: nicotinamide riboside transporter PnuC [unclassified Sphingobium]WIW89082.1 nicotinamide riboside transporter PnuC [Sphingobium sp. V4]HAF40951.1 nicotinamide mononucleotide transporter [Sphingobium sp.]
MDKVEWLAAALGLVNVVLVARRSLWNYPFGIAMVALYFFVFVEARLYSDALLQIFFLTINLYGWWNWARSEKVGDGGIAVGRLGNPARLLWLGGTAIAILGWGSLMARFTDAAAPFADATVAGMSVAAQILQSQRKYESWALWVAVDALAIGLFWSRGLIATSILYALFFVIALAGLIAWRRTMERKPA